jgi:hypothetical protein
MEPTCPRSSHMIAQANYESERQEFDGAPNNETSRAICTVFRRKLLRLSQPRDSEASGFQSSCDFALTGQASGGRSLHTGEVVGSIPTAPTIDYLIKQRLSRFRPLQVMAVRGRTRQERAPTIRGKSGDFVLWAFTADKRGHRLVHGDGTWLLRPTAMRRERYVNGDYRR